MFVCCRPLLTFPIFQALARLRHTNVDRLGEYIDPTFPRGLCLRDVLVVRVVRTFLGLSNVVAGAGRPLRRGNSVF